MRHFEFRKPNMSHVPKNFSTPIIWCVWRKCSINQSLVIKMVPQRTHSLTILTEIEIDSKIQNDSWKNWIAENCYRRQRFQIFKRLILNSPFWLFELMILDILQLLNWPNLSFDNFKAQSYLNFVNFTLRSNLNFVNVLAPGGNCFIS